MSIGVLATLSILGVTFRSIFFPTEDPPAERTGSGSPEVARSPPEPIPLAPGGAIDCEMTAEELLRYRVELAADDFLEVVVEQRGIDVAVVVIDPAGRRLSTTDSPNSDLGPERILVLAETPGNHLLEVRSPPRSGPGRYQVRIEVLRRPTAQDRTRAAAAKIFDRGEQWRRQGGQEALRKALGEYRQAVTLWQAGGDPWGEALTLNRTGQVHGLLAQRDPEIASYLRGLEIYRSLEARHEQALLLNKLGRLYRRSGQHHKALTALREASGIFEGLADPIRQTRMLNGIARVHSAMGETHKAFGLYRQVLARWRELGNVAEQATTLNNLGEVCISLAQLELARDYCRQALELRRAVKDMRGEAITLTSLGSIYRKRGELELACDYFERALSRHRELQNREKEAVTLIGLGLTLFKLGKFEEALEHYKKARRIANEIADPRSEAFALINIGWLYEERGYPQKALDCFHPALAILRRLGERSGEASALFGIALAERRRGDLAAARERVETALERVESLRTEAHNQALRVSYLAAKRNYYEFYIDLLMELHEREPDKGYDALALRNSERSRARSLLESLSESQAELRKGVDAKLLERERSLRDRLDAKERERVRLLNGEHRGRQQHAVEEQLRALAMEYREIRARIRINSPKYASLTRPQPPTLDEIQQRILDDDTLLLEYALGDERSFLWLVSREAITSHELPGRARIETLARQAHLLLTESHKQGVKVQTELVVGALSKILLGPVAQRLGTKRLLIVSEGALQYIPFAALRVSATGQRSESVPLVLDHEIISLPSAAVVEILRQEAESRRPAPKTVAVLADPVFERDDPRLPRGLGDAATPAPAAALPPWSALEGLGRLPYSREEAEAILALVPAEQRLEALGSAADLEIVRSGELAQYRIVHLATHGWLHTEHPELSGIILSLFDEKGRPREGLLYAHEIYNLELPAELVVVSACRTALGQEARGEGLISLTRGFMYAGATRVLVSLWSVSDQGTTELMKRFYRGMLEDELPPAAALQAAQVAMLRDDRWRASYYWAGFVLQGDW